MKKIRILLLALSGVAVLCTACSDDDTTVAPPPAPAPVNLQAFSGIWTNALYLSWTASSGVTNYRLESATTSGGSYVLVANTTTLYRTITGLSAGATNYYRVIAEAAGGQSTGNVVRQAFTAAALPQPVGGVTFHTQDGVVYSYDPGSGSKPANELVILTLNMHTYQETGQAAKFTNIAALIAAVDADCIAFQENAQHKDSPVVFGAIKADNMCVILTNLLKQNHGVDYYFAWDWAHYGWDVWEEGIAVMSKYPLTASQSVWVSTSASTSSLVSRKAIHGRFTVPLMGVTVNMIATHLHWRTALTDIEQNKQVNNVRSFADGKTTGSDLTLVCGDYNSQPTETDPRWSEGYLTMRSNGAYLDTFLICNPHANNMPEQAIYDTVKGDFPGRIDYIFMRTNAAFAVVSSQIIFTPAILGTVSDHYGVLTRIRKLP